MTIKINQNPSGNFNEKDSQGNELHTNPTTIVIHWMAGLFDPSVDWLKNGKSYVSAHFCIDADGVRIQQLVQMNRRAWHCGGSWHELFPSNDSNLWTIGIECEGQPSIIKRTGWGDAFMDSLIQLCLFIKSQVPTISQIVDHSTIDPLHKIDVKRGTGIDLFPWQKLIDGVSPSGIKDISGDPYASNVRKHFGLN
jgi:N-acetyl-anhydromuramyl-L-alanine amidase AmpD